MYPCFDHGTLIDLLEGAGLSWRYYAATGEAIWTVSNAITKLCNPQVVNGLLSCTGSEWANVILKPAQVLPDVKNYKLADVAWDPDVILHHAVGNRRRAILGRVHRKRNRQFKVRILAEHRNSDHMG